MPFVCHWKSNTQLEEAFEFLGGIGEQPVDWSRLEEAAGVGVVVSSVHHSVVMLCQHDAVHYAEFCCCGLHSIKLPCVLRRCPRQRSLRQWQRQ